ncbi:MAG TPA: L-threonylcarbamoyladenylate synthase [Candidatus Woesebacteria bacterium]|nr:L-threonylcarbamoyladenylate synthase [Candidatus Woesebacteria bacterium]
MYIRNQDLLSSPSSCRQVVAKAVAVLKNGGLIVYPTDTLYGIGADATNQNAVNALLKYKAKRAGKPLSIAVANQHMASQYVELNDQARILYKRYLPGPYTIISRYKKGLAQGVASEFNTVGVRIIKSQLVTDIIEALGRPISATSANASGKKQPHSIDDIFEELSSKQKEMIQLIIDVGPLPKKEASIVIDTSISTPIVLRNNSSKRGQITSKFSSRSAEETQALASRLIFKHWDRVQSRGLVVALEGELGAGKTVFAQGVANFLAISTQVTSPSYTILKEYPFTRHNCTGFMYHLDLWRIQDAQLVEELNLPSLVKPNNLVIIEWYSIISQAALLLRPDIVLTFKIGSDQQREIAIEENLADT